VLQLLAGVRRCPEEGKALKRDRSLTFELVRFASGMRIFLVVGVVFIVLLLAKASFVW
jgi:hypothetical protein